MLLSLAIIAEWFHLDYPKELNELPTPTIEKMGLYLSGIQVLDSTVYVRESADGSVLLTNREECLEIKGLSLCEVVDSLEQCFRYYNDWLKPLQTCFPLLQQGEILTAFSSVFNGPVLVVNSTTSAFSLVGDPAPFKQIDFLNCSLSAGVFDESGYVAFAGRTPYKYYGCFVYEDAAASLFISAIHSVGKSLGLVLACPASLTPGSIAVFNEFCRLEHTWMQVQDSEKVISWGDQVFADILQGHITDDSTIVRYFSEIGLDVGKGYTMMYFFVPPQVEIPPHLITPKHFSDKKTHVWQDPWNKRGFIVIRSLDRHSSKAWFATVLNQAKVFNIHMGLGAYDTNYLHVAKQYQWAKAACRPVTDDSASTNIYESVFLSNVADLTKGEALAGLPSILILRHYDAVHASRHLDVLRTYYQCNLNKRITAERLGIHRNTVQKHLDRIKELTDLDIEKQEFRLPIELYLYLIDHGYLSSDDTILPPAGIL